MQSFPRYVLELPEWVSDLVERRGEIYCSAEERMELAIELARRNVEYGTGGPFGAAIVERRTGRLLALGVNLVVPTHCSVAHAEVVAIVLAQQRVGHYDLGGPGMPAYELVTSTEPCAMCLGAVVWSGVRSLVCGARDEDARRIGFDEGPKPVAWQMQLERRRISVAVDVCRRQAVGVLEEYIAQGGPVYNARRGA